MPDPSPAAAPLPGNIPDRTAPSLEARAALFAGGLTLVCWVLGLLRGSFTPAGLVALHAANPAYFLIDLLAIPVFFLVRRFASAQRSLEATTAELEVELAQQREALAVANQRLMQRHKQLSIGIKREQSLRARADEASRAKSQFLANMSHEIRTPMNGVLGMVELLAETRLSDDQRKFTDAIRRSSEGLLAIINEVLDFSRLEADKVEIKSVAFSPRSLIEDALELVAHGAHEKPLELSYLMDPDLPEMLEGDPARIRQILVNFLGNAVKFTDEGEVYVRVELDRGEDGVERVRFSVVDTGVGIRQEELGGLFQSFAQVHSENGSRGGTGLGLAISRKLAELMGGQVGVESVPDQGSTFWFTLELHPVADNRKNEGSIDLQGARILVVSDNASIRLMLIQQMRRWNCRPSAASDGPSALSTLRAAGQAGAAFTAVVADQQMPGMDGLQLAQAIRRAQDIPRVELLLLTRITDRAADREAERLRLPSPVSKPVRQRTLGDALLAVLARPAALDPTAHVAATVAEAARQVPEVEASETTTPTSQMPASTRHRVLLVDDNAVNRRVASLVLKKAGHVVVEAVDGYEAVEIVKNDRVALVLMDIHMPRMGGLEATQAIRAWEIDSGTEAVPIVAMTAGSLSADTHKCLEVGMDGYVSKPVKAAALLAAVESWARVASPAKGRSPVGPVEASPAPEPQAVVDGLPPAVDLRALDELRAYGGDQADTILDELAQMFLQGADQHLENMREAVAKGDADLLQKAAHTLKGSSGTLGARVLEDYCRELEELGGEGHAAEAKPIVEKALAELARVRAALGLALSS